MRACRAAPCEGKGAFSRAAQWQVFAPWPAVCAVRVCAHRGAEALVGLHVFFQSTTLPQATWDSTSRSPASTRVHSLPHCDPPVVCVRLAGSELYPWWRRVVQVLGVFGNSLVQMKDLP